MIVAPRAADGQPQPHRSCCFHTVHDVLDPRLFGDASSFAVQHVITVETCRDVLIQRRLLQLIACQLLDRELIKRHVAVERSNHPVPPRPECAGPVLLITIRIGVPGGIEPLCRQMLTKPLRSQQPVNDFFKCLRRIISEKCIDLGQCRRQTNQVERNATDQRFFRCPWRWTQLLFGHSMQHEMINAVARPVDRLNCRQLGPSHRLERPVPGVRCALLYPAFQQIDL